MAESSLEEEGERKGGWRVYEGRSRVRGGGGGNSSRKRNNSSSCCGGGRKRIELDRKPASERTSLGRRLDAEGRKRGGLGLSPGLRRRHRNREGVGWEDRRGQDGTLRD